MTERVRPYLPLFVLFSAYAAWGGWAILCGERIPVNDGLGWDGQIYYFVSKDFPEFVRARVFDSYYIQRVLPSLIVRGMHWATGTEHTYELTGHFFGILNLLSMLVGTGLIVSALRQVGMRWRWIAAVLSLLSFGAVRHVFYYPILTDAFAFLLGAALLWGFLREKKTVLALAALMGAFTVPTLTLLALPLLALRNSTASVGCSDTGRWQVVTVLVTVTILALLGPAFNGGMPFGMFQPSRVMVLLALPPMLLYVGFVLWDAAPVVRLRASLLSIDSVGLIVWLTVAVVVALCASQFRPGSFGARYFLLHIPAFGLTHPAVAAVAHAVYFGPVILLMLLHPKRTVQTLNGLPLPLYWATLAVLMLAIGSESRTLSAGMPFVIYLCVISLRKLDLTRGRMAVLLVMSLLLSRFWLTINSAAMEGDFLDFPMQRYFMHIGPWMSTPTYLMQLGLTAFSGAMLWFFFRKRKT